MRISDWSSDVCSSDLAAETGHRSVLTLGCDMPFLDEALLVRLTVPGPGRYVAEAPVIGHWPTTLAEPLLRHLTDGGERAVRSEEHTSELQSLMRISYAVFCLKKKKNKQNRRKNT